MEHLFGYIERITFQNDETGFTVLQLKSPKIRDLICVVGNMPTARPGETIRCMGYWSNHLVHGRQFDTKEYKTEAPADLVGIKKYLGSGLIKGIGPVYASKIVEKFGIDTLHIIDQDPVQLLDIQGLGKKRLNMITTCWNDQKVIRDLMIFLQTHLISPSFAQKIFKKYGSQSIKKIQENPFYLARDIHGIGFKSADTIAQKLGIPKDAPQRIESAIEYTLSELTNEGHVCFPKEELTIEVEKSLEVPINLVEQAVETLKVTERIEIFDLLSEGAQKPFVWLRPLFFAETGIAKEIKRLNEAASGLRQVDVPKALRWVQDLLKIELAENQAEAVAKAFEEKFLIITGGPGTGKSTITNAILRVMEKLTEKIVLAAPTGRAAKRMTEITGRKAKTIHSLLSFNFKTGGFKHNRDTPLDCDLIVIDESSMIDTLLMNNLLKAIPTHARVVLVGDINQLPSVGPGNVLKDIIAADYVPVITLNKIYRQAAGSRIITNAHRINAGQFPEIHNTEDSDFFFLEAVEAEQAMDQIITLVTQRLPKKYGFNAIHDIQVLAPMRKGAIGTENLNEVLQKWLNPRTDFLMRAGRKFLVNDKVMQIRNNYEKEVFNGDVGVITEIHLDDQFVVIRFDDRDVEYEFMDLDEIVLAYAVSIHKYQGSECKCVVIPVHTSHFKLLNRNLLYTGVTRGKKLVVLVGNMKGLAIAVHNDEVKRRYTGLQHAVQGYK